MSTTIEEFNAYREKMNSKILEKELLGLVASAVLRCDDCVRYHLETCYKEGLNKKEVVEALSIATLVGGTIVIPHLRRAYEFWDALEEAKN